MKDGDMTRMCLGMIGIEVGLTRIEIMMTCKD